MAARWAWRSRSSTTTPTPKTILSFANNINTVDGGTHLRGFYSALTRTINAFGQREGLFKDVKENLTGDDIREGLTAVISVKVPQPQFEGQTKGKLNSDISGQMTQFVNEKLTSTSKRTRGWAGRSSAKRSRRRGRARRRGRLAT